MFSYCGQAAPQIIAHPDDFISLNEFARSGINTEPEDDDDEEEKVDDGTLMHRVSRRGRKALAGSLAVSIRLCDFLESMDDHQTSKTVIDVLFFLEDAISSTSWWHFCAAVIRFCRQWDFSITRWLRQFRHQLGITQQAGLEFSDICRAAAQGIEGLTKLPVVMAFRTLLIQLAGIPLLAGSFLFSDTMNVFTGFSAPQIRRYALRPVNLITAILQFLAEAADFVYAIVIGHPVHIMGMPLKEMTAKMDIIRQNRYSLYGGPTIDGRWNSLEYLSLVKQVHGACGRTKRALGPKGAYKASVVYWKIVSWESELQQILKDIQRDVDVHKITQVAFGVMIWGAPGAGKTAFAEQIQAMYTNVTGETLTTSMWNGAPKYAGDHIAEGTDCVVMHDPDVLKATKGDAHTYASNLMSLLDPTATSLEPSAVEKKGKNHIRPKLVIISSNSPSASAFHHLHTPDAFLRRFNVHVEIVAKQEFVTNLPGTKIDILDSAKIMAEEKRTGTEVFPSEFIIDGDKENPLNLAEFERYFGGILRKHLETQRSFTTKMISYRERAACTECGMLFCSHPRHTGPQSTLQRPDDDSDSDSTPRPVPFMTWLRSSLGLSPRREDDDVSLLDVASSGFSNKSAHAFDDDLRTSLLQPQDDPDEEEEDFYQLGAPVDVDDVQLQSGIVERNTWNPFVIMTDYFEDWFSNSKIVGDIIMWIGKKLYGHRRLSVNDMLVGQKQVLRGFAQIAMVTTGAASLLGIWTCWRVGEHIGNNIARKKYPRAFKDEDEESDADDDVILQVPPDTAGLNEVNPAEEVVVHVPEIQNQMDIVKQPPADHKYMYQVAPLRLVPPGTSIQCRTTTQAQFERIVEKATFRISTVHGTGHAIALGGQLVVTFGHLFLFREGEPLHVDLTMGDERNALRAKFSLDVLSDDVIRFPSRDIAFFLVRGMPPRKSLYPYLLPDWVEISGEGHVFRKLIQDDGSVDVQWLDAPIALKNSYRFRIDGALREDVQVVLGNFGTRVGDCGGPLVGVIGSARYLLAVVFGGPMEGMDMPTYCAGFTRKDVEFVQSVLKVDTVVSQIAPRARIVDYEQNPELSPHPRSIVWSVTGNGEYLGTLAHHHHAKTKPRVEKSLVANEVRNYFGSMTVFSGPQLRPFVNSLQVYVDPLRDTLLARLRQPRTMSNVLLRSIGDEIIAHQPVPLRGSLNDNEMVNGVSGLFKKIPMDTSQGFPGIGSKRSLFNFDEKNGYTMTEALAKRFKTCDDAVRSGVHLGFVFTALLKADEALSLEKIQRKGARAFTGGPVLLTMLLRKYYQPVMMRFMQCYIRSGISIGVNHLTGWDALAVSLRGDGRRLYGALDYSKFDVKMPAAMILEGFFIMIRLAEKSGFYGEEDLRAMVCLAYAVAFPVVNFRGNLVGLYGSNPSGQATTAVLNSIVNHLWMIYAYRALGYHDFYGHVVLHTYGDDNIFSVDEDHVGFNQISIARVLKTVGITVTLASKEDRMEIFTSWDRLEYLSRSFVFDPRFQRYMGPLKITSFVKMLSTYKHSAVLSSEESRVSSYHSALFEMMIHGEEQYCRLRDFLLYCIRKQRLEVCFIGRPLLTYAQSMNAYFPGGIYRGKPLPGGQ